MDNESGMKGNPTYTYQIKQSSQGDENYQTPDDANNISSNSYTFKNLNQGTSYDVRVIVNGDVAGRTGTGSLANQQTGRIPGGESGVEEGAITFGTATWQDGTASVTIATDTGMQLQYQKNTTNDGDWTNIDNNGTVPDLKHGDTVYARLTDGTNYGDYASVAILDGEAPENATIQLNTDNLVVGSSLTAKVTHTDNQSGVEITKSKWVMNTNSGSIGTGPTSYTGTFTSNGETITLNSNATGEYYLHVLTVDKGGNKKETISNKITINGITGTVTQKGETTWSGGKASIELETTQTQFTIEYKINEGGWQDYTGAIQNLNHGDKVTARLTNKTVQGPETEITVTDTVNPTVLVTSGGTTTNSVVVNVVASDNESGMADNVTYTYYIKQTSQGDETYTAPSNAQNITQTTYTFTGLTQGTSYDVKVEVQGDKAGNVGTGTLPNQQTSTIQGPSEGLEEGNIVASDPIWQNEKASITLTTSVEGMQIQYQVGAITEEGWTTISSGGTVGNLLHGNTVYARLYDGTNYGDYASVTILDGIVPTVSISEGEITSNSITVNVTANDGQSGLATTGTYKYYINEELKDTTEATTYTFSGLSGSTEYTIKVEAIDKGNNAGSDTITIITERMPTAEEILETGKYVQYIDAKGTERQCMVLYEASEGYGGVQIITMDTMDEKVDLGQAEIVPSYSSGSSASVNSYNNAIETLNDIANEYNNKLYSTARSVGSVPNNPDSESGTSSYGNRTMKNTDTNYKTDYDKMTELQIVDIGKSYWMASRVVKPSIDLKSYNIYYINASGKLEFNNLCRISSEGEIIGANNTEGFRPVFTLKGNVIITGGDGSQNNPYTLGIAEPAPDSAEKMLQEGNNVIYPSAKGDLACRVLYDRLSGYGVQIITSNGTSETLKLGGSIATTAMNSYNSAISNLNDAAKAYNNSEYGTARSVGSVPDDPESQAGMYIITTSTTYNEKLRDTDTNYISDYEQMDSLGILNINEAYWLASRNVEKNSGGSSNLGMRIISNTGELNVKNLFSLTIFGSASGSSSSNNIRPVFSLNSNVKVTGGDGSQETPFRLGI